MHLRVGDSKGGSLKVQCEYCVWCDRRGEGSGRNPGDGHCCSFQELWQLYFQAVMLGKIQTRSWLLRTVHRRLEVENNREGELETELKLSKEMVQLS